MSQDFRVSLSILFWQNKSHLLMLGKMCPSRITESCIKVRKSITTDYVTGATRFIGSHGRFRFRQEWTKKQSFKPRANGSNSVGQQLPTLLDVICCVRLHTLLHVVWSCCAKFETGQTFSYVQTDATTYNIVGSCCVRLHAALKVTYLAKRSVKLDHIDILLLQKREWIGYIDYNYYMN